MTADKPLLFPRYVWCDNCDTFEAHTMSRAHDAALNGPCPYCGSRDKVSAPPAHHAKRVAKLERDPEGDQSAWIAAYAMPREA